MGLAVACRGHIHGESYVEKLYFLNVTRFCGSDSNVSMTSSTDANRREVRIRGMGMEGLFCL